MGAEKRGTRIQFATTPCLNPLSAGEPGIVPNQNPAEHMKKQAKNPAGKPSPHPRTPVEKCRAALGDQATGLTDGEIEQMRDFLYQLLDIAGDELEKELLKGHSKADVGRIDNH